MRAASWAGTVCAPGGAGRRPLSERTTAPFMSDVGKDGMGGICISSGFCFSAWMAREGETLKPYF